MTDSNSNATPAFGWLKWTMGAIFDRDKDIGLYFAAALAVLFSAVMVVQTGVDPALLQRYVWIIGQVVIAAGVLIFLFTALRKSKLIRIIANVVVVVVGVYCLAGITQIVMADRFHPPMARAACLANPFQLGCPLNASLTTSEVAQASVAEVGPAQIEEPLEIQKTTVFESGVRMSRTEVLAPPPFQPPADNAVFVHFAGAIDRAKVIDATTALQTDGWTVPWAEQGGERLALAAGMNEIRYFNPEDADAAQELARQFAEKVDWVGVGQLKVRDLSAAGLSPQSEHQFEIWTSRK